MITGEHMTLQELVKELDKQLVEKGDAYHKLHQQLDAFRGIELSEEAAGEVNRILKEIQEAFHELYYAHHFICFRNQSSSQEIKSYNEFMEQLIKAGATDTKIAKDM